MVSPSYAPQEQFTLTHNIPILFALQGNKRFRKLVDTRKAEYFSLKSRHKKNVIAVEIYSEVLRRGGRFLSHLYTDKPARKIIERGTWREASAKVAVEKCKQNLRQKGKEKPQPTQEDEDSLVMEKDELSSHNVDRCGSTSNIASSDSRDIFPSAAVEAAAAAAAVAASLSVPDSVSMTIPTSVPKSVARPTIMKHSAMSAASSFSAPQEVRPATSFGSCKKPSAAVNGRSLLFQPQLDMHRRVVMQQQMIQQEQQKLLREQQLLMEQQNELMTTKSLCSLHQQFKAHCPIPNSTAFLPTFAKTSSYMESVPRTMPQDFNNLKRKLPEVRPQEILARQAESESTPRHSQTNSAVQKDLFQLSTRNLPPAYPLSTVPPKNHLSTTPEEDGEDVAAALAALAYTDQQKLTEQEVEMELASLKDDERAAAIADNFGEISAADTHQAKRARKDLDRREIEILVDYMRHEINMIPDNKKQALTEAQSKCRPAEFSDKRLERFLRCEGMNAKVCWYDSCVPRLIQ